jgi:hypothetical protein
LVAETRTVRTWCTAIEPASPRHGTARQKSRFAAHLVDRAAEAVVAAVIIVYRALMVARDEHHRTVLDPAKVGPAKDVAQPAGPAPRDAKAWDGLGRIG